MQFLQLSGTDSDISSLAIANPRSKTSLGPAIWIGRIGHYLSVPDMMQDSEKQGFCTIYFIVKC
jgi:hypothetical protein